MFTSALSIGLQEGARAEERGTNEKEIVDVINTGFSIPAKYGRVGKAKIYDLNRAGIINTMNLNPE